MLRSPLPGGAAARLRRWGRQLSQIEAWQQQYGQQADDALRKVSLSLRYRAKSGEPLEVLLPEAFALVREAGQRTLGLCHYDVQILGGIAMHHRCIAEMQTGEGKTLTATLPLYLAALRGKGAHLATANDYLARRDAEWMAPLYRFLGFDVGVVDAQMPRPQRYRAYRCDITYGTAKEFGFDFLRDRLLLRKGEDDRSEMFGALTGESTSGGGDQTVQREPFFALIDEADSILIDEARTPLIISAAPGEEHRTAVHCYQWASTLADRFVEDEHYDYDHEQRSITLEAQGRRLVRELPKPEAMSDVAMYDIYEYVERAIKVSREFVLDRHYVVKDDEVVIVDEFTGRLTEGRKWRAGIHQAVEAREGVEITADTNQAARITIQDYFLRYERLAGMTGTVASSAREFKSIYSMPYVPVPTNRPPVRQRLHDRVFSNSEHKLGAIVTETIEMYRAGRPVLIGTRSIDKSEILSAMFDQAGIPHHILNANNIEKEASIVAQAGRSGSVTIATNMAGRGTDIILGGNAETMAWAELQQDYRSRLDVPLQVWEERVQQIELRETMHEDGSRVRAAGGLFVICTEVHDASRIDRQLIGRCGRQGDVGAYRQYLALDDDILQHGLGPKRAQRYLQMGGDEARAFDRLAPLFRQAQRRVERQHFRQRRALMYHEKERKKVQKQMGQDPYLDTPGG